MCKKSHKMSQYRAKITTETERKNGTDSHTLLPLAGVTERERDRKGINKEIENKMRENTAKRGKKSISI